MSAEIDIKHLLGESVSEINAEKLKALLEEVGGDSLRFFIAPNKEVSSNAVVEDLIVYLQGKKLFRDGKEGHGVIEHNEI